MRRTCFGCSKARLITLALGVILLGTTAGPVHAWPTNEEARTPSTQQGLPFSEMVHKRISVLAKDMLVPKALDAASTDKRTPAHRGPLLELFAPGDFGVTFRYRW